MKGITHGACDFLVKPVRLEELRNIWQHVIRRKVESKSKLNYNDHDNSDQGPENGDQNVKVYRKRGIEEEDVEENGHESDDPSAQKKPRVVWSLDLHRKFVAAVNQLGIEKAVPKRILDLMNVDGLTTENVASHLQKYKFYLKRLSQQENMAVAFGGSKDASSYSRITSLEGLGDFRPSGAYAHAPSGMLGRVNSATGVTLHSLTGPPMVQPNPTHNKLQQPVVSPNQKDLNHAFVAISMAHNDFLATPKTCTSKALFRSQITTIIIIILFFFFYVVWIL